MTDDTQQPKPPIEEQIADWLNTKGFPLEMRTARVIRQFEPEWSTQSDHYFDPDTNTMREVDVTAIWYGVAPNGDHHSTQLAVECKSGDGVWVLFRDSQPPYGEFPRAIGAMQAMPNNLHPDIRKDYWDMFTTKQLPKLLDGAYNPCFNMIEKVNQEKKQRDMAYEATRQAVSGAYGLLQPYVRPEEERHFRRCIPLIVTNKLLFVAQLDTDGNVTVSRTNRDSVSVPDPRMSYEKRVEVHVVHEDALPDFMADFKELAEALNNPSNIETHF